MKNKTNIRSDHDVKKYVPGWRTNIRYQEGVSAQLRNNFEHVIEQNNHQSCIAIKSINQSITYNFTYVGPPTKARLFLSELIS